MRGLENTVLSSVTGNRMGTEREGQAGDTWRAAVPRNSFFPLREGVDGTIDPWSRGSPNHLKIA